VDIEIALIGQIDCPDPIPDLPYPGCHGGQQHDSQNDEDPETLSFLHRRSLGHGLLLPHLSQHCRQIPTYGLDAGVIRGQESPQYRQRPRERRPRAGVIAEGSHMCAAMRGVKKANARMTTSAMFGTFRENRATREEFFQHIARGSISL
jgi:GTP cyclohydrolase I-like protein